MENIAERASVEMAAVWMCGRSIPFVCSEFRSKKKFSDIWGIEQNSQTRNYMTYMKYHGHSIH